METPYWAIIWRATLLVVAMVGVALVPLFSTTTTILGGAFALLVFLDAPPFLGNRCRVVNLPTIQTFDIASRAITYPLLGIAAVLLR